MRAEATLLVPQRWGATPVDEPGVDLLIVARWLPDSGFRPRVTLAHDRTTADLLTVQVQLVQMVRTGLTDADVEEVDVFEVGEHDVSYVRVWHRDQGRDLISEIRTWLIAGVAWHLTACVDHGEYADFCDLFEEMAHSFEPPEVR